MDDGRQSMDDGRQSMDDGRLLQGGVVAAEPGCGTGLRPWKASPYPARVGRAAASQARACSPSRSRLLWKEVLWDRAPALEGVALPRTPPQGGSLAGQSLLPQPIPAGM